MRAREVPSIRNAYARNFERCIDAPEYFDGYGYQGQLSPEEIDVEKEIHVRVVNATARRLPDAELWWISSEMLDLVCATANMVPLDTTSRDLPPIEGDFQFRFCGFESPIELPGGEVATSVAIARTPNIGATMIVWYADGGKGALPSVWTEDVSLRDVQAISNTGAKLGQLTAALISIIEQRGLAEVTEARPNRHPSKREMRAGAKPIPTVHESCIMTISVARKTRPTVRVGEYTESGPSSSFVDKDYDEVLTAELRVPDHRCSPIPRKAKLGARYTCPECETVYVWSAGNFAQWLPFYEQTGQLPHSHVKHGESDTPEPDASYYGLGGVSIGQAV